MKRFFSVCIFSLFLFLNFMNDVYAKGEIKLYLFHGDGCPHCADEIKWLDKIDDKYDNLKVVKYEVWYNKKNSDLLSNVKKNFSTTDQGVPFTVVGNSYVVGFNDVIGDKIIRMIEYYNDNSDEYFDAISQMNDGSYKNKVDAFEKKETSSDKNTTFSFPFFGQVNAKNLSIPTAAVAIGLVDGFNPCAMWVLLFLIGILIGMKDRRRMWMIGFTFLFTSAIVYMAIMLSWLNIVVNISTSVMFRIIIAIVAICGGAINIRSYLRTRDDGGCEIVDSKKRKKIITRIKRFTKEKSLFLSCLGSALLAISVNLIELACSTGLPLVFTQILAINKITGMDATGYTLIYILFFLIDDIIIFLIAMKTMKVTGVSTKYSKYAHLIGGIIMLLVGSLLILKPEWLMFNF